MLIVNPVKQTRQFNIPYLKINASRYCFIFDNISRSFCRFPNLLANTSAGAQKPVEWLFYCRLRVSHLISLKGCEDSKPVSGDRRYKKG